MDKPEVENDTLSSSAGDYLKAIWTVTNNNQPAATNHLAKQLGLSAPSVSAMLGKLKKLGLVDYERYQGAQLTERGRCEAVRLIRRHRLIETFLSKYLGYRCDEVHEEAERLEHVVSDRFTERLAERLGHPTHDPHGDPIPNIEGVFPETPNTPLSEVAAGDTLYVSRLRTQRTELLAYLADLGITPGQRVRVDARDPLGELLHIDVAGRPGALSRALAALVIGKPQA